MVLQLIATFSWMVPIKESNTVLLAQEIDEMYVWDVLNTDWFLTHVGI